MIWKLGLLGAVVIGSTMTAAFWLRAPDDAAVQLVKENSARTAHYRKLADAVAIAQAKVNDYVNAEGKKCQAKGQLESPKRTLALQLSPAGEIVCQEVPPPPAAKPVAPPLPAGPNQSPPIPAK